MTQSGGIQLQKRSFDLRSGGDAHVLDKEHQKRLGVLSQELLVQLHTLMRMLNFHARQNEATQKILLKLHDAIKQLFETEYELHIEFTGSDFIINDRWTRLARQLQDLSLKLGQELQKREVGGLWITAVPRPAELLLFIRILLSFDPSTTSDPFSWLQNQLWSHGIEWLTLEKNVQIVDWDGDGIDLRSYIRQIYFFGLQAAQQIFLQAQQGKALKFKAAKRAVQAFVELFCSPRRREEAEFLMLLTNVKNCLDYRYTRAVNTAVMSIGFAQYLGFQRNTLRDIGIAALIYDIGLSRVEPELEHKLDLDANEQRSYESHTAMAVPIILNTTFIDSSVMRAVNVAFAHHLGPKGTGFPNYGQSVKSPVSQIISICEQFDALTTPHPDSKRPLMSPPQALGELSLRTEPVLMRRFISFLGVLPLGTLVQLNNEDVGYVIKQNPAAPHRPIVKIILSGQRNVGRIVDLTQTLANGQHPRSISKILDISQPQPQQAMLQDLLL